MKLVRRTGLKKNKAIIDVGGGASSLVDLLLEESYQKITVLDIAEAALQQARERLGEQAKNVHWIRADITESLEVSEFCLWHDRAVFHFLTSPVERSRYLATLSTALQPGGYVIIASFSPEGPEKCSGLPVQRYNPQQLQDELGSEYRLLDSQTEIHETPASKHQDFIYCLFQRVSVKPGP